MMLVPVRVGPSHIHGQGRHAVVPIPAGTPVWRFEAGFDRAFDDASVDALPSVTAAHVRWFSFRDGPRGPWILSGDHACFMNHDPHPNTGAPPGSGEPIVTVALRDIAAGEEITCDYLAFDGDAPRKLGS